MIRAAFVGGPDNGSSTEFEMVGADASTELMYFRKKHPEYEPSGETQTTARGHEVQIWRAIADRDTA